MLLMAKKDAQAYYSEAEEGHCGCIISKFNNAVSIMMASALLCVQDK